MLEKYFKSEKEFNEYLNKTYNPETFEKSFEQFLNSLISSPFDLNVTVNNFKNNEEIVDSASLYKATYLDNLNSEAVSKVKDSFTFC